MGGSTRAIHSFIRYPKTAPLGSAALAAARVWLVLRAPRSTYTTMAIYGNQPDEIFNLSKDPLEEHNLAALHSKEDIDKRRENLLAWRSKVNAQYGPILINGTPYSESN